MTQEATIDRPHHVRDQAPESNGTLNPALARGKTSADVVKATAARTAHSVATPHFGILRFIACPNAAPANRPTSVVMTAIRRPWRVPATCWKT